MGNQVARITNKKFEQFLFYHDIFFVSSYRAEDGGTVWVYDNNAEFQRVLAEWKDILARRAERKRIS